MELRQERSVKEAIEAAAAVAPSAALTELPRWADGYGPSSRVTRPGFLQAGWLPCGPTMV
jgi:hypothetical protein